MMQVYRNIVIAVMAFMLSIGSVLYTAEGVTVCAPRSCCCTITIPAPMEHHDRMETTRGCTPQVTAPCCQADPLQPKTNFAISTVVNRTPDRSMPVYNIPHLPVTAVQTDAFVNRVTQGGRLKIPKVPVYLQNLSLLC